MRKVMDLDEVICARALRVSRISLIRFRSLQLVAAECRPSARVVPL